LKDDNDDELSTNYGSCSDRQVARKYGTGRQT